MPDYAIALNFYVFRYLFDPMELKIGGKHQLQHRDVEQISAYTVVLRNRIPKLDLFVISRPINSLIIE